MSDDAEDDLTEAQCLLIGELSERVWRALREHPPEVIANVIGNVFADFLGAWGRQLPQRYRRQMQMDIILSIAHVAFDLLDMRARYESQGKGTAH